MKIEYSEPFLKDTSYYRIRIGDYRIGIKGEGDVIVLMRVMHRKDIYRVFPSPQSEQRR